MGRRSVKQAQGEAGSLSGLAGLFRQFLPAFLWIRPKKGAGSRTRLSSQAETFFAFLAMVLERGASVRMAVALLQANRISAGKLPGSSNTSAFCQARLRLPLRWLQTIFDGVGEWFARRDGEAAKWHGLRVLLLDGTGFSMPDSKKNQAVYPLASGQKPGCGFPAGKLAGLFCLHTGRLVSFVFGTWRIHDLTLARSLVKLLKPKDILVADRAYGSWSFLAALQNKDVDFLIRLHQGRKVKRKKAGSWIETWQRPQKPERETRKAWAAFPAELTVRIVAYRTQRRGFRSHLILVVTSLLDKVEYPDSELGKLYGRRWQIELHFRQIKVSLGLDVLRCVSPAMIERELWMHAIAYNLIRALMAEAATVHEVEITALSFKGTLTALQQLERAAFARSKRTAQIRRALLARIAGDLVPRRPGRSEPRAKKRRPKNYPLLTKPRKLYRVAPSRSKK